MNYVDGLIEALRLQLRQPHTGSTSGAERTWFLVIEPERLRSVLARLAEFELVTKEAGRKWVQIDLSDRFGTWMGDHRYSDRYFKRPDLVGTSLIDFADALAADITAAFVDCGIDEETVVALTGVEALYGINKLSEITVRIEDALPGNLLVFFPGEFHESQYRFFDARDGWNYLAVPLLPTGRKTP